MDFDPQDLREHYAMLSDEALVALDRSGLIDVAQQVYDQELRKRRITSESSGHGDASSERDDAVRPKPGWLNDAACAATFFSAPGSNSAPDASHAREVLDAAGIPCYIDAHEEDPPGPGSRPQYELRLMVPAKLNLEAVSILDKEIYNAQIEEDYRTHFEQLSDEELQALDPAVLLAGLADRIERLTRVYNEEIARRRTE